MRHLVVATFSHPDFFGGAERVIGEVCARLVARGDPVTLVTSRPEGGADREDVDGVAVHRYDVDRSSTPRFYRSVFGGVRTTLRGLSDAGGVLPFDVAHLHQLASAVPALAPGGGLAGLPVVGTFHAPYHREYLARHRQGHDEGPAPAGARTVASVLRRGDRYVVRRCDRIVVLSQFARAQVAELDRDAAERTTIAPAGVDLERFRPAADRAERRAARRALGLPEDVPLVLSVRRLVPRMGLPDLLEAAAELARAGSPLHLVLAGDGELRESLAARAAEPDLAGRVTLLGRVPDADLPTLYRASTAFALPTRALEGFGMSTVEALASGLPVVATDVGGSAEVLQGIDGSVTVPAGAPVGLARALDPLIEDSAHASAARTAARAAAESRFHWDGHLDAVVEAARQARDARGARAS